jgi:molybdopterin synthase catalytic subunit
MYNRKVNKKGNGSADDGNEWNAAINLAKERIKRLKASIKLWKEMRDSGEKWPGFEKTTGTAA